MWRDMERRSAARGLPFRRPSVFPRNGLMAARVATAALAFPEGRDFCRAVFAAGFAEDRDIADPAVIVDCLDAAGLPEALAGAATDPAIKDKLRHATAEAAALGLFGAPSFTVAGELFWGDDRLDDALAWAGRG